MDHEYQVLSELPKCCLTCYWCTVIDPYADDAMCEHPDRASNPLRWPKVSLRGLCSLWLVLDQC